MPVALHSRMQGLRQKRRRLAFSGGVIYEPGQAGRSNPKYMLLCSEDTGLSRGVANPACASAAKPAPAARD